MNRNGDREQPGEAQRLRVHNKIFEFFGSGCILAATIIFLSLVVKNIDKHIMYVFLGMSNAYACVLYRFHFQF